MKKLVLLFAFSGFLALLPPPASAIKIVTTAKVLAPDCCYSVAVLAYMQVTVSEVTQAWVGRPITWYTGFDILSCAAAAIRQNRSFCCITPTGAYARQSSRYQAQCPIAANSLSEAYIGGNGLPILGWGDISACIAPCRPDCI